MAKFRITHEGSSYIVDAPDEASAMEALGSLGGAQEPPAGGTDRGAMSASQLGMRQGLTLGFGDELMAGALTPIEAIKGAITGEDAGKGFLDRAGDAYNRALTRERADLQTAREQHPVATGVGQVAGGLVTGGQAAQGGLTLVRAGQNLPTMIGAGALEGAAYGGVTGYGEGEGGVNERAASALSGAQTGAAVGAAIPVVARGVGAGVGAVRDRLASSPAQRLVMDDIAAEGLTPADLAARRDALGPAGMVADTSETLRLRAEQLAQSDNPARPGVMEALKTRTAGAEARTAALYDAAAGERPNVKQTLDDIITTRSAEARPLYEQSLSKPVVWDNRLQAFLDDPVMKKGLAQGVKIQRLESLADDVPFKPEDYAIVDFDAAGDPIVAGVPNMRTLNVAKKGLDAMVEASKNEFGKLSEEGRAIDKVRRAYVAKLDASNPDYAAARKSWQGNTEVLEAFQKGRDIFKSSTHPDFLAADVGEMSAAAKDALELGVRAAAGDTMGQVRNGALKGRTLLDAENNERKLIAALGEERARPLINGLLGEGEMASTANQALGNSATARRQDNPFRPSQKTDDRAGILRNAANLQFGEAAKRGFEYAADAVAGRRANNLARDVGPMLTAQGPEADRVVQALIAAQARRAGVEASNPQIEGGLRGLLMGAARQPQSIAGLISGSGGPAIPQRR